MDTILNIFQVLVAINGLILFEFKKNYGFRYKFGMALAGITLALSALFSYNINAWYPLFVGYLLLYLYKFLGLDPSR